MNYIYAQYSTHLSYLSTDWWCCYMFFQLEYLVGSSTQYPSLTQYMDSLSPYRTNQRLSSSSMAYSAVNRIGLRSQKASIKGAFRLRCRYDSLSRTLYSVQSFLIWTRSLRGLQSCENSETVSIYFAWHCVSSTHTHFLSSFRSSCKSFTKASITLISFPSFASLHFHREVQVYLKT